MFELLRRREYQYTPLNGALRLHSNYSFRSIFIPTALLLITALTSFYAGRQSLAARTPQPPIHLSTRTEIFRYNRTFGAAPSNTSNAAWESLFPTQGGFFKHPTIAPQRSAWAVFHQLHCLNGIRQGYWALHAAATSGTKINESEIPMMQSPPHIRHCIDLIRHSLMCQPDITVEIKDPDVGGVTGFGTEHVCRDWGQLMEWTGRWEGWMQERRENGTGMEEGPGKHMRHGHGHE